MKLVREHINEKFEENSDPVEDMGIGVRHIIEQVFKDRTHQKMSWDNKANLTTALAFCGAHGLDDCILYLLDLGADLQHSNYIALRNAAFMQHPNTVDLLIKSGADVDSAIRGTVNDEAIKILKHAKNKLKRNETS